MQASGADAGESSQRAVVDFLLDPRTHGVAAGEIERVDTHIATVVLAGDRAYKLKRAVKLPFLDFSTLAAREAACRAELRLNRRTAPALYLGVRAVRRAGDGGLTLDGAGEIVEWLVEMRRFDQSRLLDRLAERGALDDALALPLAATIADFHGAAEAAPDGADAAEYRRLIAGNDEMLRRFADGVFDAAAVADLKRLSKRWLARSADLIDARRRAGRVRHCHGDLHLRNIFLEDGHPVLFDAIEFDDRLARTDVMYDLAFLLMDLWHRRLAGFANAVMNRYMLLTGDRQGLTPLPLFLSLRAAIRAHVSATTAEAARAQQTAARLRDEAGEYLALARRLLRPTAPRLIAIGGFSGSGKSTLARALAPRLPPPPGALVARSDEIRKHIMGLPPESPLPPEAYVPAISRRVYAALRQAAGEALAAGYGAIADAVHDRTDARREIRAVAAAAGVPFDGFWLEAAPEVLAGRIGGRREDASDATPEIMRRQIERGSRPRDWHRLDAAGQPDEIADAALTHLRGSGPERA